MLTSRRASSISTVNGARVRSTVEQVCDEPLEPELFALDRRTQLHGHVAAEYCNHGGGDRIRDRRAQHLGLGRGEP